MKFKDKIIDLSTPIEAVVTPEENLPEYMGHICWAYNVKIKSHTGSYFETPAHIFKSKFYPFDLDINSLIFDCLTIKVNSFGRLITERILKDKCREIKKYNALLVVTGWNKKEGRHPYFSKDAGKWIARSGIKLLGADIPKYDSGFINPEGMFIDIFKKDISIIAGLNNMNKLPEGRCKLLVMPLLVKWVCTVPARVIAIVNNKNKER